MLTRPSLFSLPPVLLSALVTHAYAYPDGVIGDAKGTARPTYATVLTGGEGCDLSDLDDIRDGFSEMTTLFAAATPFDVMSQAAREFFGPSISANYTDMIAQNLQRAANYGVLEGEDGAVNADIHIRCDDPMDLCNKGNSREGDHAAYNIGNEPHIVFCSDYFRMESLEGRIDKKAADQILKDRLMEYYNRASLWARMVMHFSDIGTAVVQRPIPAPPNSTSEWLIDVSEGPMNTSVLAGVLNEQGDEGPTNHQTLKYAYGATRAKLLATLSTQMPYDAANNAENYALYALSKYIINDKGFYPSVPIMDFPNEASVLTNENLQDGERCKYAFFDMTDVVTSPLHFHVRYKLGNSTLCLTSRRMNRHQSGCRGKEPELTRTGTDRGYRPAHSQRAPCYTAVWLFYEFFRAGFLAGASSQPIVQVFDLLAIEILAFVAFVLLRPFEGQRLNVIAVYLLGSSKVATAALSVAFDTRYSVPRIPTTVIKIVIIVIQGLLTIAVMELEHDAREVFQPHELVGARYSTAKTAANFSSVHSRPEVPKTPYFEVKQMKRMARIEDEDLEFMEEINQEPAASRCYCQNNAILRVQPGHHSVTEEAGFSRRLPTLLYRARLACIGPAGVRRTTRQWAPDVSHLGA
ncbi:hypothetical protein DDE82_002348 [Stemphylium lycopersici]|nr:hypothetical protein DDE82_002348 [Stemphylium lycopersici]